MSWFIPVGKVKLGRHEKFAFRYNWLKKSVDAVFDDPYIFTKDEALVVLGVGKNMVRSIRHWGLTLKILEEQHSNKNKMVRVSSFGQNLLSNNGWDPYLEDVGTLWLLHWKLSSNLDRGLVWHVIFSAFYEIEFAKSQLIAFTNRYLNRINVRTTPHMIEREVEVFLRTYVPARHSRKQKDFNEGQECPLTELRLIRYLPMENVYQFVIGPKTSLPTAIFGYALLDFLAKVAINRPTVGFDEIIYGHGGPGQIFKLDENSTIAYLEEIAKQAPEFIKLTETAGLRQIYLSDTLRSQWTEASNQFLKTYYEPR